jgi:voltage-gated potassium channel Kch
MGSARSRIEDIAERRIQKHGLRPRLAAAFIAACWLAGIVVFGVVEHLVDRDRFETIWEGMWWSTQTVTTVGYGDVVPGPGAGRFVATVLMIGGLSLFAVITGVITSLFVARAQADQRRGRDEEVDARLQGIADELTRIGEQLAGLAPRPPGRSDPP